MGSGFRAVSDFEYMQTDLDKISFQRGAGFRERDFNTRIVITHYRHETMFVDPKNLLFCTGLRGFGFPASEED